MIFTADIIATALATKPYHFTKFIDQYASREECDQIAPHLDAIDHPKAYQAMFDRLAMFRAEDRELVLNGASIEEIDAQIERLS